MALRSRAWLWWIACGWLAACGARTGEDLRDPFGGPYGGTGGVAGSGGNVRTGGSGNVTTGGSGGYGASCSAPTCDCPDCFSGCVCVLNDPWTCDALCFGGTGGTPGTGGVAGSGGFAGGIGGFAGTGGFAGGIGGAGGSTGACCQPSSTPGCRSQSVQDCVCSRDLYCCSTAWDSTCVRQVDTFGCGSCSGGAGGTSGSGGFGATGGVAGAGGTATGGRPGSGGFGAIGGTGGISSGGSGGAIGLCQSPTDQCAQCLCGSCGTQLETCFSDIGCPLVLECMGRTGCFGFGCYQAATCRDVIDSFGGFFADPNIQATSLIVCAFSAGCQCN